MLIVFELQFNNNNKLNARYLIIVNFYINIIYENNYFLKEKHKKHATT